MVTTKNIAEAIRREIKRDTKLAAAVEAEIFKAKVGSEIFKAREEAGLTQKQLADLANMKQSAIARLENADYDGHSFKTLERIATALNKQIEIRFVEKYTSTPITPVEAFNIEYQNFTKEWERQIKIKGLPTQTNEFIPVS